jgi:hypothetical protein
VCRARAARSACSATIALLGLLVLGAGADPSGLLAVLAWQGWRPVSAVWWWAPYVVYLPALLAANFLGTRTLLASTRPCTTRPLVFLQLWGIGVLSTAAAAWLCMLVITAPDLVGGRLLVPTPSVLAFLLWSCGYAAVKMALLGWIPSLAGAWAWRPQDVSAAADAAPFERALPLAGFVAAGGVLALALLGPWLARHWWQGSPIGYIYGQDKFLFAPTPASGVWADIGALLIYGFAAGVALNRGLGRLTPDASASARFCIGAIAALAGAACLLVIQALLALGLSPSALHHDHWQLPATYLRAAEAGSFALVAALPMAVLAAMSKRLLSRIGARQTHAGRLLGRGLALLAVAAVGLCLLSGHARSAGTGEGTARSSQPSAVPRLKVPGELPRLRVLFAGAVPRIADTNGAQVTLRGINVNQLNEYYLADPRLPGVVALAEQDFSDIAAIGLNSVRLTLSWSRLEPRRGEISPAYLRQIHQAVDWARRHRLYVILDVHQDAWSATVAAPEGTRCRAGTSPMTGWDGAPAWATLTDERPPCEVTGRDLAPNVSRAFQSFYFDRDGIQSELVRAWALLAQSFAGDTTVAGYDLLNEPNFAESPPLTSTLLLANYYAHCIRAIRAAEAAEPGGFAHLVFVEPSIIWSGFGVDNLPPRDFTADQQIVFSPHLYNESITVDQDLGANLISIERGFALARDAAEQLHAPLWIGEWGFFGDPRIQAPLLERQARAEDTLEVGSAVWVWKQACGDPHVYPNHIAGNIRRLSCPDDEELETLASATTQLRRPYVRSAPGHLIEQRASGGRLELTGLRPETGTARSTEASCGLEVWTPGASPPVVVANSGVEQLTLRPLGPGSALLGPSGGWLLDGCVAATGYHLLLQPGSGVEPRT